MSLVLAEKEPVTLYSSSYVSLCAETCTINSEEEAVEAELQSILTGISAFSSLLENGSVGLNVCRHAGCV